MEKHLYRSRQRRIVGGVCGGIGEYFGLDPTLVRIITVLLFLLPGIGILTYIILWIIIPARPFGQEIDATEIEFSPWNRYLPGIVLIAFGILLLFREYFYHFTWSEFWPIMLIVLGLGLIVVSVRRSERRLPRANSQPVNGHNGGNGQ